MIIVNTKEPIPILVFHRGNAVYLECCLNQAKKYNPDSRIILLGDSSNAQIKMAEHYNADDFLGAKEFKPLYKHCSFLSYDFEWVCIERWFAIRDFVRATGINRFLHIDTDVLLFCNVTEEAKRFEGYDATVARWDDQRLMAHFLHVNNTNILEGFCDYMTELYSNEKELQRLIQKNINPKGNRARLPWVSDMSLLNDYYDQKQPNFFFLENTLEQGVGFENRITDPAGFQTEWWMMRKQRIKKIRFENDLPIAWTVDGKRISMKMLHYHSLTKYLMPYHVRGIDAHWRFFWRELLFDHKIFKGRR